MDARIGSLDELRASGQLRGKHGSHPVVVFWHEDRPWAIEDRCPHMGFPLHQGTVEAGLVTCHWHHARFDLASGCTLDPFADDARAFDVEIVDGDVVVRARPAEDATRHHYRRLHDGLEDGLTLVIAKSVLGLLDEDVPTADIVREGVRFGTEYRAAGWGAGLTVLVAMANLVPDLERDDRALALVHGLAFVSRDTRNHPPRFALTGLGSGHAPERLAAWYRRFADTRSADAAERVLQTALAGEHHDDSVEQMMFAAVTDHVFIDGGHTIDFTNKAFEALAHIGADAASSVLPTLVRQTARASRSEEESSWRYPHDLAVLAREAEQRLLEVLGSGGTFDEVAGLGERLLAEDPHDVVDALIGAARNGATPEQLGRAVAYAAALRITRFHTGNDFGDWDTVHHAFTSANALHHALQRNPTPELARGLVHNAFRVYLDRFLNVPPARLPSSTDGALADLAECWDAQGMVDEAGSLTYGYLRGGGDPAKAVSALAHALLREDAEFHWFQVLEAAVRQFHSWPQGSEPGALVLAGLARFLAAHTPTRRELSRVVDIASRLRHGEELHTDADAST